MKAVDLARELLKNPNADVDVSGRKVIGLTNRTQNRFLLLTEALPVPAVNEQWLLTAMKMYGGTLPERTRLRLKTIHDMLQQVGGAMAGHIPPAVIASVLSEKDYTIA